MIRPRQIWHIRHLHGAQKIVTADFSFPPGVGVSEEVRDLLQRIFVVNAAHRLNLEGIKAHPWFLRNLPAELQARPSNSFALALRQGGKAASDGAVLFRSTSPST